MGTLAALLDERIAKGDVELPIFPQSVSEVVALCSRDDVDMRGIAAAIHRDPTLAAHMLRIANSPLVAPQVPITTLQQALARLGTCQISQIALVIVCRTRAFDVKGRAGAARKMLRHAVATAAYAREIARLSGHEPDEAFLCGLVHDVGEPAVLQLANDIAARHGLVVCDAELAVEVERLHEKVGGMIARSWKLAPRVVASAEDHHPRSRRAPRPRDPVVTIVQLADVLADVLLRRQRIAPATLEAYPTSKALGLSTARIETLESRRDVVEATVDAIA